VPVTPPINSLQERKMFVYLITNKINGKRYIGQTIRPLKYRFKAHQHPSTCAPHLYNAIKKYGEGSFSIEALAIIRTKEDRDFYEKFLIKEFDLRNPIKGYNITEGGDGALGYKFSEESKKRMSEANKRRQKQTGQFESIRTLGYSAGGKITGPRHKELKTGIFAPGLQSKGGKVGCRTQQKNRIGLWAPENIGKGGRTNAESGHLVKIGWFAAHMRCHVPKNIVNPKCFLCLEKNNGTTSKAPTSEIR
jgi:GIY-YIG catalytic domain-containing protein